MENRDQLSSEETRHMEEEEYLVVDVRTAWRLLVVKVELSGRVQILPTSVVFTLVKFSSSERKRVQTSSVYRIHRSAEPLSQQVATSRNNFRYTLSGG